MEKMEDSSMWIWICCQDSRAEQVRQNKLNQSNSEGKDESFNASFNDSSPSDDNKLAN